MKKKRLVNRNILFFAGMIACFACLAGEAMASADLNNTYVLINGTTSATTVAPGSVITIGFQLAETSSNQATQFAVLFDKGTGLPTRCETDVIAGSDASVGQNRVYGTNVYAFYGDGASANTYHQVTARATTWDGEGGTYSGVQLPTTTSTSYRSVTIVTKVPPEYNGTYYIHVIARGGGSKLEFMCSQGDNGANNEDIVNSAAITVSGAATPYKLDLEMCYNATSGTQYNVRYRIVNRSESGVRVADLSYKFWWYDSYTNYVMQQTRSQRIYNPAGTWYRNGNLNFTNTDTFTGLTAADCTDTGTPSSTRQSNRSYTATFSNNALVAAGGGFLSNYSYGDIIIRRNDSATITKTDDYWMEADLTSGCSSYPTTDTKYAGLYYTGLLVCEYDTTVVSGGSDAVDDLTGEEPCDTSGCPKITLTKTADKTTAIQGDTISYCITATNTGSSARTFTIWDTVPTGLTYLDCSDSCTRSGTLVYWTVTSLAASSSVTRCYRATVTGWPLFEQHKIFFANLKEKNLLPLGRHSVLRALYAKSESDCGCGSN
jgi:uncharacterized repeat protein (TIGR01451 family)